jgi:hypothetical protein
MTNTPADAESLRSGFKPPAISCLDYLHNLRVGEVAECSRRTVCKVTFMRFQIFAMTAGIRHHNLDIDL